jgi:hypothetical protein
MDGTTGRRVSLVFSWKIDVFCPKPGQQGSEARPEQFALTTPKSPLQSRGRPQMTVPARVQPNVSSPATVRSTTRSIFSLISSVDPRFASFGLRPRTPGWPPQSPHDLGKEEACCDPAKLTCQHHPRDHRAPYFPEVSVTTGAGRNDPAGPVNCSVVPSA